MIHSTVSPDTVKAAAEARGARTRSTVIDAPVTVTRYDGADAPFVCMMIGAGETAAERARPSRCLDGLRDRRRPRRAARFGDVTQDHQ